MNDYKSTGGLLKQRGLSTTLISSKVGEKSRERDSTSNLLKAHAPATTSVAALPFSRERMQRDHSELEFTAGFRRSGKASARRRILGEKDGF